MNQFRAVLYVGHDLQESLAQEFDKVFLDGMTVAEKIFETHSIEEGLSILRKLMRGVHQS